MFKSPFSQSKKRSFTNAEMAVEYVKDLYDQSIATIRSAFEDYAKGLPKDNKVEAYYPFVSVRVEKKKPRDTRLSYGFVSGYGEYKATLTRPDLFHTYYLNQFEQLLRNHDCDLEVGYSNTPIPIHFAFQNGKHIEGDLDPERIARLREIFSVPDLSNIDDNVANGRGFSSMDGAQPLSLFSAPRVDYSLHRLRHYTGTNPSDFQSFVIFTNYQFYIEEFLRLGNNIIDEQKNAGAETYTELVVPALQNTAGGHATLPQMPAYHLKRVDGRGVTMINIGVGPSNARNISDHVAVLRPDAWIMLGHCAGLRETQKLGDYVLAHGYVRDDKVLDHELPKWVPIPALAEVQQALEKAVSDVTGASGYDLKSVMRTGTVVSTDNRNWEISGYRYILERFSQSRAIALDMESAVIAANGFRFRVPYGTLLCVSDRPFHGEIKLPGMASNFYRNQVNQHLAIGLKAIDYLRDNGHESLHSRKLRSFTEVAFR
ncbi:MAG: AMP nucleosidase [Proteobacteria bacterium]|jgi:AMP nucleosidase|nr:AMP nucleosidase [Alphaproteobacteria bacterium]NCC03299.1 AMP nucleosidase [Pseudomonadota bacterium]